MALIKCKECGAEISSTASKCPHCGDRTEHGRSQTQSAVDLVVALLLFAEACLGIYWFVANVEVIAYVSEIIENYDYYSEYYGFFQYLEYKLDPEEIVALIDVFAGIALIICGLVGMHSLKKAVEKRKRSAARVISSYYKTEPSQPQEVSSDKRWECPNCHNMNPPAAQQACVRCGAVRVVEESEEMVTCPECGDTHKNGTGFCTSCGTKL